MTSIAERMQRLQKRLDLLIDLIPAGSNIALIDEPVHRNIGDQMIQWGSRRFFEQHRMRLAYRASTWDYRRSRARANIGPSSLQARAPSQRAAAPA